ncbi:MAG: MoxR family ATPase [Proteobacteria bacterium]|nr:MoxR family ATPase [Pseudomonadota bacterium]
MKISDVSSLSDRIVTEVERAIVGKTPLLRRIMTAVLADGHILLEDYPGLAKTLIANSFATALGLDFKRIQFTPDLLPGDITGGTVFNRATNSFDLRKGPIFTNIVLADEINRASPRTQSALLEAMQERQVSIEGETLKLPEPFMVIATQNPIESEGTFPIPEAQLDRFLMKLSVGYPSPEEELEILNRRKQRKRDEIQLNRVSNREEILLARRAVEDVFIEHDVERYIVDLLNATRKHNRITVGASPRAGLALLKLILGWAAMEGREYVLPDDVKQFIGPTFIHRLILVPDLWMQEGAAGDLIEAIRNSVPVPIIEGI